MLPDVFLPSESSTITAGRRREPLPFSFGTGVRADSMPRRSASPIAVPPSATSRSSASLTGSRSVVGGTVCSA